MTHLLSALLALCMVFTLCATTVNAARDTNSYDGNIYPIYAGNGSIDNISESALNYTEKIRSFL